MEKRKRFVPRLLPARHKVSILKPLLLSIGFAPSAPLLPLLPLLSSLTRITKCLATLDVESSMKGVRSLPANFNIYRTYLADLAPNGVVI